MWVIGAMLSYGFFRVTWVRMGGIWVLAWIFLEGVLAFWSFEVGVGRLVVWLRVVIRCSFVRVLGVEGHLCLSAMVYIYVFARVAG